MVENTGTADLVVSSVALMGPNFREFNIIQGTTCSAQTPVAPGDNCQVVVQFNPTSTGVKSATLVLTDNAPGSPHTAPVSGTGVPRGVTRAELTPHFELYGDVLVGSSLTHAFALQSTGTANLVVGTVTLTGADPSQFQVTNDSCSGATLAPGVSCMMTVAFSPTSTGPQVATLEVTDDTADSPQTASLHGTGVQPEATLHPDSRNFGTVAVGTSETQVFTLESTGTAALVVGTVNLSGPDGGGFKLLGNGCNGVTLPPGDACQFAVEFAPSSTGARSAAVLVADNAPGSPQSAGLSGEGVQVGEAAASLSPSYYAYGEVAVRSSRRQSFVLMSTGSADLVVDAVTVSGRNSGQFQIIRSTCAGATLAPGARCQITVEFTPSSIGVKIALLEVGDNATDSTQTASLAGLGAPAPPAPGQAGVPSPCDPLISTCGVQPSEGQTPAPLAPPTGSGNSPAVGAARMPNLRATVAARWVDGTVRVTIRLMVSKPRLVDRWFRIHVAIASLDATKNVRVRAHPKRATTLVIAFPGSTDEIGKRVAVSLDPEDRVTEAREGDNRIVARVG